MKRKYNKDWKKYRSVSWKHFLREGSYTVEAAAVMGMTFLVLASVLYLCSFWYGRSVLTASAYEQAFTERQQQLQGIFGVEIVNHSAAFDEKVNEVTYNGICSFVWGRRTSEIAVQAEVKQYDPVRFIWKLQSLGEIIEEKDEES